MKTQIIFGIVTILLASTIFAECAFEGYFEEKTNLNFIAEPGNYTMTAFTKMFEPIPVPIEPIKGHKGKNNNINITNITKYPMPISITLNNIVYNINHGHMENKWDVLLISNNSLKINIKKNKLKLSICKPNQTEEYHKVINLKPNISAFTEDDRDMTVPSYREKRVAKIKKKGKMMAKVKVNLTASDADFENVTVENGEKNGVGYALIHTDNKSQVVEEKQLYIPIVIRSGILCIMPNETNSSKVTPEVCYGEFLMNPVMTNEYYLVNVSGTLVFEFSIGEESSIKDRSGGSGGGLGGGVGRDLTVSVSIGDKFDRAGVPKDFTTYLWLLAIILIYIFGERKW